MTFSHKGGRYTRFKMAAKWPSQPPSAGRLAKKPSSVMKRSSSSKAGAASTISKPRPSGLLRKEATTSWFSRRRI